MPKKSSIRSRSRRQVPANGKKVKTKKVGKGKTSRNPQLVFSTGGVVHNSNKVGQPVRISHQEYFSWVDDPQAIFGYNLNPGLDPFIWIARHATMWEQYRIVSMVFRYEPTVTAVQAGVIHMAIDYDAHDPAPSNYAQMAQYSSYLRVPARERARLVVSPKLANAINWHYTREEAIGSDEDIKNSDFGRLWIGSEGPGTSTYLGDIYVEYTIEFQSPQLQTTSLSGHLDLGLTPMGDGASALTNIGNVVATAGNLFRSTLHPHAPLDVYAPGGTSTDLRLTATRPISNLLLSQSTGYHINEDGGGGYVKMPESLQMARYNESGVFQDYLPILDYETYHGDFPTYPHVHGTGGGFNQINHTGQWLVDSLPTGWSLRPKFKVPADFDWLGHESKVWMENAAVFGEILAPGAFASRMSYRRGSPSDRGSAPMLTGSMSSSKVSTNLEDRRKPESECLRACCTCVPSVESRTRSDTR